MPDFVVKGQVISGHIVNEQNAPVPYATIFVREKQKGTITNSNGDFKIRLNNGNYHFVIRSLGYIQIEKEVQLQTDSLHLDITMKRQEFEIKEVKVFPGDEDPAYFIVRKAMAKAAFYRKKIKHYEADLYIKSNFTFTNIPKFIKKKIDIGGKKPENSFLENYTSVIESHNKITYDYPKKYKQEVLSKSTSLIGFDEPPVMGLMTGNFYEDRMSQVISPLSPLALRHYNYQYEGFITNGKFDIFKIKVEPKRKSDELVSGYIYIVDRLWCLYSVDLQSRIEFFRYRIKQQYENLGNANWLPVSHLIEGEFSALGLKGEFYYGASLKYKNIEENFTEDKSTETADTTIIPKQEKSEKEKTLQEKVSLINAKEDLSNLDVKKIGRLNRKILKEQYKDTTIIVPHSNNYKIDDNVDSLTTNPEYWDTIRAIPLTHSEIRSYEFTDSLRAHAKTDTDTISETTNIKNSFLKKIITGHHDFCKDSLIRFGYNGLINPKNFDFNAVDGYKINQQFHFYAKTDSGKIVAVDPKIGYAINRKALFWDIASSFEFWNNNLIEIDFGKMSRDFKTDGISPALNSISTWFFAENNMKLYETSFLKMKVKQRFRKNLRLNAGFQFNHFFPLKNHHTYKLSNSKSYASNIPAGLTEESSALMQQKSLTLNVGGSFRIYQRKPWLPKSDFLFISDFYEIGLDSKLGIKDAFSSVSNFSHIDFNFLQQVNISPTTGIEWHLNTGTFFHASQLHFSQYKHFQTNEIPVSFQPFKQTFQLLNDYQCSTSESYLNIGTEIRTEYLLLRYLSLVNRGTWSESFYLNYLATPTYKNYWEAGYSLNNLFFVGNVGIFAGFLENKFEQLGVKFSISAF